MNEHQSNRYDRSPNGVSPALERFSLDLRSIRNAYDLSDAFITYLQNDLSLTNAEANVVFSHMLERGVVSTLSVDEPTTEELTNEYRIALFTDVRPLYLAKHTVESYDQWLPRAIGVMLSDADRHTPDICYRTNGRSTTECEQGRCPLRVIQAELMRLHVTPDFDTFEYIADADHMHKQAEILRMHARAFDVVSKEESRSLEYQYEVSCRRYFGRV